MKLKSSLFLAVPALLISLNFVSCKKDEPTPENPATTTSVKLKMRHYWEGYDFVVNEETDFINSNTNDTLAFTVFKYYISNIRLEKADGTFYIQPDSYFLVDASNPAQCILDLGSVPAGTYTDLYYTFGVDSLHNVSGAQDGALDPSNGMFWSWSTGYIMSKMEGISPNSQFGNFAFHLGGFQGMNSVVIEKHIDLTTEGSLSVVAGSQKQVEMYIAVNGMLFGRPSVSVVSDMQSPGPTAHSMAVAFLNGMFLDDIQ